jgi:hypothetical protein
MQNRKHFTLSLNEEIVRQAKKISGLVPFSRFVEALLIREIKRGKGGGAVGIGTGPSTDVGKPTNINGR